MGGVLHRCRVVAAAAVVSAVVVSAAAASGTFVEPVNVIATLQGSHPGANFGWAVSELGDIDGDGAMDVIVGEPFTPDFGGTTGVFSGRTGAPIYRLDGAPRDLQGFAIADVGDVNGDGVSDLVSGAPQIGLGNLPPAGPGRAYVYSGATGDLLHTFTGERVGDELGFAVGGAGDVDGDGRPDVIVGAPSRQPGGSTGTAYVYSGRTYRRILTLAAGHHEVEFGSAVDGAGDLNGDGVPDLVVGARENDPGKRGAVYAFSGFDGQLLWIQRPPKTGRQYGSFFVAGLGDTNGDAVPDVYVGDYAAGKAADGRVALLSGDDGRELLSVAGASGAGLGPGRGAGDVDGDGLVDLVVGSYTYGPDQAGRAELRSGLDGSVLRAITSTTAGENFGFDAVGIGDVNGDGRPDIVVSAATGETVYIVAG